MKLSQGWNEFDFPRNNIAVLKVTIGVNQSNYEDLQIAEIQIFFLFKLFHSCTEWFKMREGVTNQRFLIYNTMLKYKDNIAKIESGATCSSSSGLCTNAIKDSVLYIDDLWQPSSNDKIPFLRVEFIREFNVIVIKVNQPIENTIDSIYIKNEENLIVMNVDKTSNWTEISTNINTKWIRFQVELSDGDVFKGFYEVEAYGYKPKIRLLQCALCGTDAIKSYISRYELGHFTPQTTNECDSVHLSNK